MGLEGEEWDLPCGNRDLASVDEPRSLSFKAARDEEVESDDLTGLERVVAERDIRRGARATWEYRKDIARMRVRSKVEIPGSRGDVAVSL
jgi:hypothetical protein